jgi:hypothetical protein
MVSKKVLESGVVSLESGLKKVLGVLGGLGGQKQVKVVFTDPWPLSGFEPETGHPKPDTFSNP